MRKIPHCKRSLHVTKLFIVNHSLPGAGLTAYRYGMPLKKIIHYLSVYVNIKFWSFLLSGGLMNIKDKLKLLRQFTPNDLLYKFDLGMYFR